MNLTFPGFGGGKSSSADPTYKVNTGLKKKTGAGLTNDYHPEAAWPGVDTSGSGADTGDKTTGSKKKRKLQYAVRFGALDSGRKSYNATKRGNRDGSGKGKSKSSGRGPTKETVDLIYADK